MTEPNRKWALELAKWSLVCGVLSVLCFAVAAMVVLGSVAYVIWSI